MSMFGRLLFAIALVATGCELSAAPTQHLNGAYIATAYAQKGVTASGQIVHPHVVAADPDVLPIGTRIKIRHAGRYSGEYVVADTGDKIVGRRLDIYLPSALVCKKFGTKRVSVRVIELGDGTHQSAKQADQAVKADVKQDVSKNVVGNAATQADWAASHPGASSAGTSGTTTTSSTTVTSKTTATQTTSTKPPRL